MRPVRFIRDEHDCRTWALEQGLTMNKMQRGAQEANEESDRLAHARVLGEAAGKLLAALNALPTEADVRRIVREELEKAGVLQAP